MTYVPIRKQPILQHPLPLSLFPLCREFPLNIFSHNHPRTNCKSSIRASAFSKNTLISHNHVAYMPYTGISIGFRWNTTPTSQSHCIVEYNHIHDVMIKIADGGGIYTLGYQPQTVLRGNHIYNVHRSSYAHGGAPNNGIFFDEGSKGFLVEDNVIYGTSGNSIRFNQNKKEWHTWRNNSFGIKPDKANFPKATANKAGPQEPYRKALPE